MTTLKDQLSDEELQALEEAEKEAKREKTKYGSRINDE